MIGGICLSLRIPRGWQAGGDRLGSTGLHLEERADGNAARRAGRAPGCGAARLAAASEPSLPPASRGLFRAWLLGCWAQAQTRGGQAR